MDSQRRAAELGRELMTVFLAGSGESPGREVMQDALEEIETDQELVRAVIGYLLRVGGTAIAMTASEAGLTTGEAWQRMATRLTKE